MGFDLIGSNQFSSRSEAASAVFFLRKGELERIGDDGHTVIGTNLHDGAMFG